MYSKAKNRIKKEILEIAENEHRHGYGSTRQILEMIEKATNELIVEALDREIERIEKEIANYCELHPDFNVLD